MNDDTNQQHPQGLHTKVELQEAKIDEILRTQQHLLQSMDKMAENATVMSDAIIRLAAQQSLLQDVVVEVKDLVKRVTEVERSSSVQGVTVNRMEGLEKELDQVKEQQTKNTVKVAIGSSIATMVASGLIANFMGILPK